MWFYDTGRLRCTVGCMCTHTHSDVNTPAHTPTYTLTWMWTNVHTRTNPCTTLNAFTHTCTVHMYEWVQGRETDRLHQWISYTQQLILQIHSGTWSLWIYQTTYTHYRNGRISRCPYMPVSAPLVQIPFRVVCDAIRVPNGPMHILKASQIKTTRSTNTIVWLC